MRDLYLQILTAGTDKTTQGEFISPPPPPPMDSAKIWLSDVLQTSLWHVFLRLPQIFSFGNSEHSNTATPNLLQKKYVYLDVKEADKSASGNWFWDEDKYTKDFLTTFRIYFISDKF